jgi:hypothetical protein
MSWKIIGQVAAEPQKHNALQELNSVNALIDWTSVEAKLSDIHTSHRARNLLPYDTEK